ncbi:hypothetical protein AX774_g999 [Zancudomyces culisetae]|uniref:Uncharacterized protein n=1 Tax=Zancudomyces culisetae TaxID=1213189 RepID=A0A1R1PWZ2_ZANCU|nr:hypothetical protein AX774_g999 [Zancudomyces culisetae]|eukprot:OMH85447.1 hypothetical protein AX774_g999 [Zancudomyces culisetae]
MFGREQTKESEYFNVNDMGNQEFRVLSTKLAHLGYSYPLAKNCVPLVNAILQDLELSMKKLQDAQNENSRAKKEMGVLLAENRWLEGNNEMLRLLENTKKVEQSRKEFKNLDLLTVQQARINSLQEEVEVLKAKHTDFVNEIELNQRQLEARDIEILSLNNQIRRDEAKNKKYAAGGGGGSSQETVEAREKRLHDQLEYVQEYADDVEKEKKEIAAAYEDEKDTLRRKLTECREQIENLKRDLAKESGGGEGKKGSFGGTVVADGGSGKGENNVVESTYTSMDNIQPSFQEIKENVNLLVKNMEFRILTLTQSLERMIKEKMYYTGESEEINNIKKELKEIRTVMMQIKNVYLEAGQTRVEFELREKNKTLDSELQVTKQELSNLQSLYRQVDEQLKYERVKLAEQTLKQDSKGVAMPKQEEGVGASSE